MQGFKIKSLVWVDAPDGPDEWVTWCNVAQDYHGAGSLSQRAQVESDRAARILAALDVQPAPDAAVKPTDAQVASACLSYRHDFGLLNAEERQKVMFQAREWLHAWQKELDLTLRPAPDAAPLSPTAVDARPAPVDPKVAALVDAVRRKIALDAWERTVGGVVPEPLRGVDENLRAALAALEGRGNE